ncbi:replicative DNA helicase [Lacticaseibacillus pabuli]|uniref:Replicative DNA helicase n=1 Tax=Lacticaseibacillus pabuli TaxID=3025672 RepID=A0ABY7WR07_9LACO|nr:replicative DNA helicase [Lacticaseibacillus sp. KACC 23028]WDF82622.1 replicative DNA helicase [Lacticaseibacillus sp. KACC 23028]
MDQPAMSRQMPQNNEAEKAVLGAILIDSQRMADAQEYVTADDFYQRKHQLIFTAMTALSDRDEAIDNLTVQAELERTGNLEDIGGAGYLIELADAVSTVTHISYYAQIVKQKATSRRLIQAASAIADRGFDDQDDPEEQLEEAEETISRISQGGGQDFRRISDVLNSAMTDIDQLMQQSEDVTGLATGFPDLDHITTGLHQDELVVIAARPGMGKTAFALNIAQNVGTKTNEAVAIFSLEMGAESLVNRMLCSEGSINANHLRTGQLTEEETRNLIVAMGSLARTNIYFDDTPGIRVGEIRAKCRRLARQPDTHLGLIVIDYLQLIEGTGKENRQQEVSEISRQLKKLAKELHVPVIAMSQLSRSVEQRQDKRPVLSDIRESGAIEQDADIVAFLYREDYYRDEDGDDSDADQDPEDQDVGEMEIIIEKNRSGARGTVKLLFVKSLNKFSSIAYQPS